MIPRYKANGRVNALTGKRYPDEEPARKSEEELVPVRSILTKVSGDLSVITPDLIGTKYKDFTDGAGIGVSFATSLTEAFTQSALGLKHGGHERVLNKEGYLRAPKNCTFREEGKWIYLKVRGGELKYPRPENLVTLGKDTFTEGENVCCAYTTTSPIYKLNTLIKLMSAQPSIGTRYFEKDDVIVSDCYACEGGKIHYAELPNGTITVTIGESEYLYNPRCMYYFPEGATVKKFDRICSGVVDMNHIVKILKDNVNDIYLIFRKQVFALTDGDFGKNEVWGTPLTSQSSTQEELIELLFTGLTSAKYDAKENKISEIEYQGTRTSIGNRDSFFTNLSFGYSNRVVSKALKGDIGLSGDIMTDTILGLLINNKLDEK